ncbi:hypothetical protein [Caballeronia sp. KNU42]
MQRFVKKARHIHGLEQAAHHIGNPVTMAHCYRRKVVSSERIRAFATGSGNSISMVNDFPEIAVCNTRFRRTDHEAINFDKS